MSTRSVGAEGERQAIEFLQEKGYVLLQQNFCVPGGEIDIIMKDADVFIFIEVKKRKQGAFGKPEDSITTNKTRLLKRATLSYLTKNNLSPYDTDLRMDLVAIESSPNKPDTIRHYKNAFAFDDF